MQQGMKGGDPIMPCTANQQLGQAALTVDQLVALGLICFDDVECLSQSATKCYQVPSKTAFCEPDMIDMWLWVELSDKR